MGFQLKIEDHTKGPHNAEQGNLSQREANELEFFDEYYKDMSKRRNVLKFYSVNADTHEHHMRILLNGCDGKKVLEYGCGQGVYIYDMARAGSDAQGFDLAPTVIERCMNKAKEQGLEINFQVMNAHHTEYENNSFDIICGSGILHHLDINQAYPEIARLLRPDGYALFCEGLGNNPLINLYRKLTPRMRTQNEQPLRMRDLQLAKKYFDVVELEFHHCWTLAAVPFRNLPGFKGLLAMGRWMDRVMFKLLPFTRSQAWLATIILRKPKK